MRDVKEMLMLDKLRDPSIISKGRRNFDMEITGRHGGCLDMTLPEALDKILISVKTNLILNASIYLQGTSNWKMMKTYRTYTNCIKIKGGYNHVKKEEWHQEKWSEEDV